MDKYSAKTGDVGVTISTFLYFLYTNGAQILDEKIVQLCTKIDEQSQKPSVEHLSLQLHAQLPADLNISLEQVSQFVQSSANMSAVQTEDVFDLGKQLVEVVRESLGEDTSVTGVQAWFARTVPTVKSGWQPAESQTLLQVIRQYEFSSGLPWLTTIVQRGDNGIEEMWLMVEKVTDVVMCMDPYPWDDIEEDFVMTLSEFLIKWELCGSVAFYA